MSSHGGRLKTLQRKTPAWIDFMLVTPAPVFAYLFAIHPRAMTEAEMTAEILADPDAPALAYNQALCECGHAAARDGRPARLQELQGAMRDVAVQRLAKKAGIAERDAGEILFPKGRLCQNDPETLTLAGLGEPEIAFLTATDGEPPRWNHSR